MKLVKFTKRGFTLIEVLVVVLIIGILGAIMLPQYQRAVLKSRYSGMMPIAKALAEGNEVFFLEHGHYSENPADLMIAGRDKNADAYPDGTRVLMYDDDGLSYVRVMNDNVPNARYLVYQKHSTNFPDTTQCEAADDRANELCQALGGELIPDGNSSGESEWTAYLLSGRYGSGDQLIPAGENNSGEGGDEPGAGDEPGENNEPQTPQCDENDKPADIEPTETNPATGTATCVNGQWKYQWTGGKVYDRDYTSSRTVCKGDDSAYKCAGSEFKGQRNKCEAWQKNACAGSIFSGQYSYCLGGIANGCADSTFSGAGSACDGNVANVCTGSTFIGTDSYCNGRGANACAGTTFSGEQTRCIGDATNGCAGTLLQAGAYCWARSSGGCDGAKYGEDPTGQRTGIGVCHETTSSKYCPNGAPIRGNWNSTNGSYNIDSWKGGYCDATAMVSGVCPNGSPTGSATVTTDKTTAAGWYGGYCDPTFNGTCPAGSPKQGGGCWDGSGNQTTC